jgi:hypothetical protein
MGRKGESKRMTQAGHERLENPDAVQPIWPIRTPDIQLSELAEASNQGMLSQLQVQILRRLRLTPRPGIKQKGQITRDEAVRHIVVRTACGSFWETGMTAPRYFSLFPLDLLCERASDLKWITTRDPLLLASDLALQR